MAAPDRREGAVRRTGFEKSRAGGPGGPGPRPAAQDDRAENIETMEEKLLSLAQKLCGLALLSMPVLAAAEPAPRTAITYCAAIHLFARDRALARGEDPEPHATRAQAFRSLALLLHDRNPGAVDDAISFARLDIFRAAQRLPDAGAFSRWFAARQVRCRAVAATHEETRNLP